MDGRGTVRVTEIGSLVVVAPLSELDDELRMLLGDEHRRFPCVGLRHVLSELCFERVGQVILAIPDLFTEKNGT